MSRRLTLVRWAMPPRLRLRLLDELAAVTSAAFGVPPPSMAGLRFDARLARYAQWTAEQAETVLGVQNATASDAAAARLRRGAAGLGAQARRVLGVRSDADALDALGVLYHHIGIEARRGGHGEILVSRCLFADYFSEPVCRLMVALDEGVAAGLSDGGRLKFVERLTAGAPQCRAHLLREERR